jgi:hypothetical protein
VGRKSRRTSAPAIAFLFVVASLCTASVLRAEEFDQPIYGGGQEFFGPPVFQGPPIVQGDDGALPFFQPPQGQLQSPFQSEQPVAENQQTGTNVAAPAIYSKAVGKTFIALSREGDRVHGAGCTATIVSPPSSPVTAVALASHCIGIDTFDIAGHQLSGFSCRQNKYWNGRTGNDVEVCFTRQHIDTGLYGCIDQRPVHVGDHLRLLGYGNPVEGRPQTNTLGSGSTRVVEIDDLGAFHSSGDALTSGDSGGPVVRKSDEPAAANWGGHFDFVGINSKSDAQSSSIFAPFTPASIDYFRRAMNAYVQQDHGPQPQICGVNFQPSDVSGRNPAHTPSRPPSHPLPPVQPQPPVQPSQPHQPLQPLQPPAQPVNPPSRDTQPLPQPQPPQDHSAVPPVQQQPTHPVDPRDAVELLADRLRPVFPRTAAEVPTFLAWLRQPTHQALGQQLLAILQAGPSSPQYQEFFARLEQLPGDLISSLTQGLQGGFQAEARLLADPQSALNQPWLRLLNDRALSLRRSDEAMIMLNALRTLARENRDGDLAALAARWAASLTADQRAHVATALEAFQPPKSGIPVDIQNADEKVKRFLAQAVQPHPSVGGGESILSQAQQRANDWARNWNLTLREAVGPNNAIDLNKTITVHEENGARKTTREWIEKAIHNIGYDELVRWATSVGGETGEKTLALLAQLDKTNGGAAAATDIGILPAPGQSAVPIQVGAGNQASVTTGTLLNLGDSTHPGVPLASRLAQLMPIQGQGWEDSQFVRPSQLGTGPHPQVAFGTPPLSVQPGPLQAHQGTGGQPSRDPASQPPVQPQQPPVQPQQPPVQPVQPQQPPVQPVQPQQPPHAVQPPPQPPRQPPPVPRVIEFHIPAGTGQNDWNSRGNPVIVPLGSTLRIINDDGIKHILHTDGVPCPHGDTMWPGGGSYDCPIATAFTGRLRDHYYPNAGFWIRTVTPAQWQQRWLQAHPQPPPQPPVPPQQPQQPQPPAHQPVAPQPPANVPTAAKAAQIMQRNCLVCHDGRHNPPAFPSFVTHWPAWERKLSNPNDPDHGKAEHWLSALYSQVAHGAMLRVAAHRAAQNGRTFSRADQDALKAYVTDRYQHYHPQARGLASTQPLEYVGPGQMPTYRAALAQVKTANPVIADLLSHFDIIYDHDGMPSARQRPDSRESGYNNLNFAETNDREGIVSSVTAQILGPDGEWAPPFNRGFGIGPNQKDFFLMQLPRDASGNVRPIATYQQKFHNDNEDPTQRWVYPVGTRLAEVVMGSRGIEEIRFREKKIDPRTGKAYWDPDVLKKYATPQSLVSRVESIPGWSTNPRLSRIVQQAEHGGGQPDYVTSQFGSIFTNEQGEGGYNRFRGTSLQMPSDLTPSEVKTLFTDKAFESIKGAQDWGIKGHGFGIGGAGPSVDRQGCINCHRQAGLPVDTVVSQAYFYGSFSGDDGILSFYPQDPAYLRRFAQTSEGDNRHYRTDLIDKGFLKPYSDVQSEDRGGLYRTIER